MVLEPCLAGEGDGAWMGSDMMGDVVAQVGVAGDAAMHLHLPVVTVSDWTLRLREERGSRDGA